MWRGVQLMAQSLWAMELPVGLRSLLGCALLHG